MESDYTFFTKDITFGDGKPLKVILEVECWYRRRLPNPEEFFNSMLIPEIEKRNTFYWNEKVCGMEYIIFNYNFERCVYLSFDYPTAIDEYNKSFPSFVYWKLSAWAGKRLKYDTYPFRDPFRFCCYAFNSGCREYWIEASAEASLTRDFKLFPPTEDELAVWRALRKTKSPVKASEEDKTLFLIEYAKRINSNTRIKINKYHDLYL